MAIVPVPASREEWLKLRRSYIGGSEAAILFGLQKDTRQSLYTLYHVKKGNVPEPDLSGDDTIEDGNDFEPAILRSAARREKWTLEPAVFATDDHCPGMAATLDAHVLPGPEDVANGYTGPGALEAKMVRWDVYSDEWLGDEPPPYILLQHQHQLACTGWNWGAIAALVGGRLYRRRYMRDETIIEAIREKVAEFWDMVRAGREPDPDHRDSTLDTLRHLYPRPKSGAVVDMSGDNELPGLWDACVSLSAEKTRIEKLEKAAKAKVRQRIGPNERFLLADGRTIYRSVGEDIPPRPARPGEEIPGRRGQDRLYFSKPKETAA